MADNDTTIAPATGPDAIPVASDEIDGIFHQRMKLEFGVDGVVADVSGDDPLPVAAATLVVTGTGVAVDDTPIPQTDVLGYNLLSLHIAPGDFAGELQFLKSNDFDDWLPAYLTNVEGAVAASWTGGVSGLFVGAVTARYFQCIIAVPDGSDAPISATLVASSAGPPSQIALIQSGNDGLPVSFRNPPEVTINDPVTVRYMANDNQSGYANDVGQGVGFDHHGHASVAIVVSGTWVGTISFFADDDTGPPLPVWDLTAHAWVTDTTTNGSFLAPTGGTVLVAQTTAWTSGEALITYNGYLGPARDQLVHPVVNGEVVSDDNPVPITMAQPDTPSTTSVASSIVSVPLLAANADRKGAVIWNDSTATLYVKFGTGASVTSATYPVGGGATLELPHPVYTGSMAGIWSTADGFARVTEVV